MESSAAEENPERRFKPKALAAEQQFAPSQDEVKTARAGGRPDKGARHRLDRRGSSLNSRHKKGKQEPRRRSAEGDPVRNDKVLHVDEGRGDQSGKEHGPHRRRGRVSRPEAQPDAEERQPCDQLHDKIPRRDRRATPGATPPKRQPTDQRQV